MADYVITRQILGDRRSLPISQEQYEETLHAWEGVLETLGLEEKMNLVLENYAECEQELLEMTLTRTLFRGVDWTTFVGSIHTINRRLTNLLSSGRLYLDHASHAMSSLFGAESDEVGEFDRKKSEIYDSRRTYRIMEKALRNYSQHRKLPVHGMKLQHWADDAGDERLLRSSVVPYTKPEKLRQDPWFGETSERERVLSEFEAMGEEVDLRPVMRGYVSGLTEIHQAVRELVREEYSRWTKAVRAIPARWKEEYGDEEIGVGVATTDEVGSHKEFQAIFLEPIERTDELRRSIRESLALERLVITNEEQRE